MRSGFEGQHVLTNQGRIEAQKIFVLLGLQWIDMDWKSDEAPLRSFSDASRPAGGQCKP